ncbi:MAG: 50S ribosomal protein L9 [Bacteroidales bacterium]|jgi:large subunit ribosomal protein L9|nr:50S ribosomal protein L9 [Bacteroidales bacterium]MBR6132502.1 50S ribosomal protein L9 [Bacteroidales bacterium]
MEIILKQDVNNLGYADDLVKVKDGYARNYLIPQGLAELATPAKKKMLAETLKQRAFKAEKIRKEAEFLAGKIDGLELTIPAKASDKGTIFGSVTSIAVANALKEQHDIEIDRRKIVMNEDHIKELGDYTALVNLHKDFNKVSLKLHVVAETEE